MERFIKAMQKVKISEDIINDIVKTEYKHSDNIKQDNANRCAVYMHKMEDHFQFYYQKALGVKLKLLRIENASFIDTSKPCCFIYEII